MIYNESLTFHPEQEAWEEEDEEADAVKSVDFVDNKEEITELPVKQHSSS